MGLSSADKISQKWSSKVSGAAADWVAGSQAVQTAPGQAAAAKQDAMRARVLASIDNGTWARNVAAVPLEQWKASVSKASGSYSAGATKGAAKIQRYFQAAIPRYQQIRSEIKNMPNASDADRTARMLRNLELMRGMKGVGKGQ